MQVRVLKQSTRKHQRTSTELQERLENLSLELEDTRRLKPLTPFSRPRTEFSLRCETATEPQTTRRLEYKVCNRSKKTESKRARIYTTPWTASTSTEFTWKSHTSLHVMKWYNDFISLLVKVSRTQFGGVIMLSPPPPPYHCDHPIFKTEMPLFIFDMFPSFTYSNTFISLLVAMFSIL